MFGEAEAPEVSTAAEETPTECQLVEEETVATEVSGTEAAEPEAGEPVPEIVISESASGNNGESEEVPKTSEEEVPSPEPVAETKIENGELESPCPTEDVVAVDALPTVNGECAESPASTTTETEECVNGSESPEETPINKEQSDLKKDASLSGGVQEVPDAVPDMVEAVSTEISQAV